MKHKQQNDGFTIIELLVVIVVIGILAAITIVSFNGIQARAQNVQRMAAIDGWAKAITLYKAQNGVYPTTSPAGAMSACLSNSMPETSDFTENACMALGSKAATGGYLYDSALMSMIVSAANVRSDFPTIRFNVSGLTIAQRAIAYYTNDSNLGLKETSLQYYIDATQTCAKGVYSVVLTGVASCKLILPQ